MISTSFGMDVNIIGCPGLETAGTASALAAMAEKINGMAYVSAPVDNVTEAKAFRGGLGNREIMVLYPNFIGAGGRIIKSSAAAMGLRAKIDGQVGFHKSISNVNVSGVIGISAGVSWSLIPMSDIDMELEEANGDETMRVWRKMDFIKFNEACNKLAIAIADLRPELEV